MLIAVHSSKERNNFATTPMKKRALLNKYKQQHQRMHALTHSLSTGLRGISRMFISDNDPSSRRPPLAILRHEMSGVQKQKERIVGSHEQRKADATDDVAAALLIGCVGVRDGETEAAAEQSEHEGEFVAHATSHKGHIGDMCPATPRTGGEHEGDGMGCVQGVCVRGATDFTDGRLVQRDAGLDASRYPLLGAGGVDVRAGAGAGAWG